MSFKISNVYKSLVRHLVETTEAAQSISPGLAYHSWDARNEEAELPNIDLIGLSGWTFKEDRGLWMVHCGITLSTVNDDNLLREVEIVDIVHDFWGEQKIIPLRDDQGNEYSQLVVEEFDLLPAGQSEKRNYRPLGLELLRSGSA
jgi:hypothetical protein